MNTHRNNNSATAGTMAENSKMLKEIVKNMTIQDIVQHFNVSHRYATKIKKSGTGQVNLINALYFALTKLSNNAQ